MRLCCLRRDADGAHGAAWLFGLPPPCRLELWNCIGFPIAVWKKYFTFNKAYEMFSFPASSIFAFSMPLLSSSPSFQVSAPGPEMEATQQGWPSARDGWRREKLKHRERMKQWERAAGWLETPAADPLVGRRSSSSCSSTPRPSCCLPSLVCFLAIVQLILTSGQDS